MSRQILFGICELVCLSEIFMSTMLLETLQRDSAMRWTIVPGIGKAR